MFLLQMLVYQTLVLCLLLRLLRLKFLTSQPLTTRKQLEEIHDLVLKISNEMKRLRVEQKQAPIPVPQEFVERTSAAQSQV